MFEYSLLHWPAFFTAALLLTLSPGPDLAFILGQTAKGGRKSGFAAMFGIWGGTLVHVLLAAIGLSAALAASEFAFTLVKWLGVAYLVWLGVQALYSKSDAFNSEIIHSNTSAQRIFIQGALITLLNPKVALFFLAFLPQFIVQSAGPAWAQFLLHGFLLICVSALVEPVFVLAGERLTKKLRSNQGIRLWIDRCLGMLFIALGIRLAFESL